MGKVIVGRGKGRATIDGPDAAELEALVREVLGDSIKVLDDAVDEVFINLKRTWPVFKGKSLAGWEKVMVVDPANQTVRISLVNPAVHITMIKSGKHGKTQATRVRYPFHTDARIPIKEKSESVRQPLKQALMDALSRKFNG